MRKLFALTLTAALGTCALSVAASAADKKPAPDNLYVSSWETGNKQFFSHSGWHGVKQYWMAGAHHGHGKMEKKGAKKAEPKK